MAQLIYELHLMCAQCQIADASVKFTKCVLVHNIFFGYIYMGNTRGPSSMAQLIYELALMCAQCHIAMPQMLVCASLSAYDAVSANVMI